MLSLETLKIAVPAITRHNEIRIRVKGEDLSKRSDLKSQQEKVQYTLDRHEQINKELSEKLQPLIDNDNQELLNRLDERINKSETSLEDKIRQHTILNLKIYDELREKISNQEKVINENKGEKFIYKLFEDNKQLRQKLQEQNNRQKINLEQLHKQFVEQQHEKLQRQQINHEQLQFPKFLLKIA